VWESGCGGRITVCGNSLGGGTIRLKGLAGRSENASKCSRRNVEEIGSGDDPRSSMESLARDQVFFFGPVLPAVRSRGKMAETVIRPIAFLPIITTTCSLDATIRRFRYPDGVGPV
jgi:hypothetical protein